MPRAERRRVEMRTGGGRRSLYGCFLQLSRRRSVSGLWIRLAEGLLAIAAAVTLILWVADSLKTGEIAINLDALYLPIAGLIVIGVIQMLPLRFGVIAGHTEYSDLVGTLA